MPERIGGFQPEELLIPERVNLDSLDGAASLYAVVHDFATGGITRRQANDAVRVAAGKLSQSGL